MATASQRALHTGAPQLVPTLTQLHQSLAGGPQKPVTADTWRRFVSEIQGDSVLSSDGQVTFDEFMQYIDSPNNSAIGDNIPHDMNMPLTDYFISSSHNTYLVGNQLTGDASEDQYRKVLICGCRCVEIDAYDGGDGEPIATHGGTACGKIKFRDIMKVVKKFGFAVSEFPVVLNIENHCSVPQQQSMARVLIEELGENLGRWDPSWKAVPSPVQLRRKCLVRMRINDKTDPALSAVVFFCNRPYEPDWSSFQPRESVSLSSNEIKKVTSERKKGCCGAKLGAMGIHGFIAFSRKQVCRAYPPGGNVMSGNYKPDTSWAAGFQLAALNWQTACLALELNQGKFMMNGGCGYVLKPRYQRDAYLSKGGAKPAADPSTAATVHFMIQSATMIEKPDVFESDDLYVRIQIFGAQEDTKQAQTPVAKNKQAPVWGRPFVFSVKCADLCLVRIAIYDKDVGTSDDFIAGVVFPFPCLRPGYRNLRLVDRRGHHLYTLRLGVAVQTSSQPPQAQRVKPSVWARDLIQRTFLLINNEDPDEVIPRSGGPPPPGFVQGPAVIPGPGPGPDPSSRDWAVHDASAIDDEHLGDRIRPGVAPDKAAAPAPSYAVANRPSAEHGLAVNVFYEIGGNGVQQGALSNRQPSPPNYGAMPQYSGPAGEPDAYGGYSGYGGQAYSTPGYGAPTSGGPPQQPWMQPPPQQPVGYSGPFAAL